MKHFIFKAKGKRFVSSYAIALYNKKAYAVNSALEKRAKFSGYMVIISTNSE